VYTKRSFRQAVGVGCECLVAQCGVLLSTVMVVLQECVNMPVVCAYAVVCFLTTCRAAACPAAAALLLLLLAQTTST